MNYKNKNYILAYTARRKKAKRHLWGRYSTLEDAMRNGFNPHYDFTIYYSTWDNPIYRKTKKSGTFNKV